MYVTHDQTEAMTLGDRIVIMKDGYLEAAVTVHGICNSDSRQSCEIRTRRRSAPGSDFLFFYELCGSVATCRIMSVSSSTDSLQPLVSHA